VRVDSTRRRCGGSERRSSAAFTRSECKLSTYLR
jgi:hypothetical protein